MTNEFEEEIAILEHSNIEYKEEIFYIYTDFYKDIITSLNFRYKFLIPKFKEQLISFFKETMLLFDLTYEINYNKIKDFNFLKTMFEKIKTRISQSQSRNLRIQPKNCNSLLRIIERYSYIVTPYIVGSPSMAKADYLNTMNEIINVLILSNLDFDTKAHLILIIKENLNNFRNTFTSLYNERSESAYVEEVMNTIILEIIALISKIIAVSDDYEIFKINLKIQTYELIKTKVNKVKYFYFSFRNFKNDSLNSYYCSLNDVDKELFMQSIIKALSGYNELEKSKSKNVIQNIGRIRKRKRMMNDLRKMGYNIVIN